MLKKTKFLITKHLFSLQTDAKKLIFIETNFKSTFLKPLDDFWKSTMFKQNNRVT